MPGINMYNLPPEFFNLVGMPDWMWGIGTESMGFNDRAAAFSNFLANNQEPAQMYANKASSLGITPDMDMQSIASIVAQVLSMMRQGGIDPSTHLVNPNFKTSTYNPFSAPAPTGPQVQQPSARSAPQTGVQTPPPAPSPNPNPRPPVVPPAPAPAPSPTPQPSPQPQVPPVGVAPLGSQFSRRRLFGGF